MEAEAGKFSQKQRMFIYVFAVLSCDLRKYMHQFLVSLKTIIFFSYFSPYCLYMI